MVLKLLNGMEVSDIKLDLLINTTGLLPEFQQCPMLTTTKNGMIDKVRLTSKYVS